MGYAVGMYFIVVFVSPLYFAIRGRWGAFAINLAIYLVALFTLPIFGLGILFWLVAAGHALFALYNEVQARRAADIAKRVAAELKQPTV